MKSKIYKVCKHSSLNVRFSITRDGDKKKMHHYLRQRDPVIFNKNNATTVSEVLRQSIDEFKGEIEAKEAHEW